MLKGGWRPHDRRAFAMAIIFCLVCAVYLVRLLNLTVVSRDKFVNLEKEDPTKTYYVTMKAQRGGIYDCQGVPLVTNEKRYNLYFNYGQISADAQQGNETILQVLNLMESLNLTDCRAKDYFPLSGTYPDLVYTDEAQTPGTTAYARLALVIRTDSLDSDISAKKLTDFFIRRYKISKTGYSNEEITDLIRVRYAMESTQFSSIQPYTIAYDIGENGKALVSEQGVYGLWIENETVRHYHYPGYASHILGRVGSIFAEDWPAYKQQGYSMSDKVGISGCELAFETYLRGIDGVKKVTEDENGHIIDEEIIKAPIAGKDVYLTIDIRLQVAAEEALPHNVSLIHSWTGTEECDAGSIVAIDPTSAGVLAIASYPTYNLATFQEDYETIVSDKTSPMTNRATHGLYAPGSTFKVGMAVAAIMEKAHTSISAQTELECAGIYTKYTDYQPTCWVYTSLTSPIKYHGWLNAVGALSVSCNCYFYEVGDRMGIDTMNAYCRAYGLGLSTGIEIGEKTGTLAGPGCYNANGETVLNWYAGDTLSAAIGQSYNEFTPLQLANYISTVLNGGTRYKVHLLKSVCSFGSTDPSVVALPEEVSSLQLSKEALGAAMEGMKQVVETSSTVNYLMNGVPVQVGAKTGTAQKTGYADYAMFVCAAPYDHPDIVVSVCMEKGSSGGYSAYTAAEVLKAYFADGQVPKDGTTNQNAVTKSHQSSSSDSGAVG